MTAVSFTTLARPDPDGVLLIEVPARYGAVTIGELVGAEDPVRYGEVLRRWARTTWDAYGALHGTAREWIATAQRSR